MQHLNSREILRHFRPISSALWLISPDNGSVEILRDDLSPQLEGQTLGYAALEETYRREYVYAPDRDTWTDNLTLPALERLRRADRREKTFDLRFRNASFGFEWQETTLSVIPDDRGAPDIILLSSRSVNASRSAAILEKAVQGEYDYVVYIEARKNSYVMYSSSPAAETFVPPVASDDYAREVFEFHQKRTYLRQEERDRLTRELSVAHVRPILEKEGVYVTYCSVFENGVPREKKLRFSYFDRKNDIWLLTRTDITEIREEKRQKQLFQDALNAATVANRAKSEFLSRMSHDIRTPMNAIIGMTAIAGMHMDDRERIADCLGKITMASKLLLSLINEVLDMAKVESGKIVLSEEEIQLPELIQGVVAMIQPTLDAKRQSFRIHVVGVKNEAVIGDAQRLQQVLLNLLANAVKYTPEGGAILLEICEKSANRRGVGRYEFVVADSGVGMKPEFLSKIFEPFERADDASIRAIQGTGLGMSIAKSIVEMMDGAIAVESVYGKGSRFSVAVSLRQQQQTPPNAEGLADLPVLVADDDEVVCRNTCQKLAELGMRGCWTLRGADAVRRAVAAREAGDDYFAVILDLRMPDLDGIETARQIRARLGPDIPIIMISAYDWSEYEDTALSAGVNDFIMKPIFRSQLAYKLKRLLAQDARRAAPPPAPSPVPFPLPRYRGKRILLVEDNELNREIAQELLSSAGIRVETAENGQIAVDRVRAAAKNHYDLIFMDIQMPVMDGCAAAAAIRALPRADVKSLPIIAMTANAFSDDVRKTQQAGMNEHLAKPINVAQLFQTLRRWLGDPAKADG